MKFCEIDIISTIKTITSNPNLFLTNDEILLPKDIVRFEYHMFQPVRIHNVYKVAREKNKDKDIKSRVPVKDLNLQHEFAEGPFMTLADIILYPCFEISFSIYPENSLNNALPLTVAWFKNVQKQELPKLPIVVNDFFLKCDLRKDLVITKETIPTESLYGPDPILHETYSQIFTKQFDVNKSLSIIESFKTKLTTIYILLVKNLRLIGQRFLKTFVR